ncbi:predicted GPI-anchored protein 23 [Brachypodium distachyon]|nr:predicted GPI-anchored protein 23 [Brachypodium distachyon]XP_024314156.1 predicted GPI-anchored protein 23 [Brachypodium distachyon]|eukprot:XP_010228053.1 predicted GPI-anchored protein 23 [Brachypodium distachyon]
MGDIRAPHSTTTGDSTTGVVATDSATGAPGALAADSITEALAADSGTRVVAADSATGALAADSITEALAADSGTRVVAPDSTTGALAAGSDTGKRRGRRNLIRPLFGAADDAGKGKGVSSAHEASLRSATLLLEAEDPALRSGAVSDTANRPSRPDPATPPPEKAGAEVASRSASGKRPRRPWNPSTSATPPASSSPAGTALSTIPPPTPRRPAKQVVSSRTESTSGSRSMATYLSARSTRSQMPFRGPSAAPHSRPANGVHLLRRSPTMRPPLPTSGSTKTPSCLFMMQEKLYRNLSIATAPSLASRTGTG